MPVALAYRFRGAKRVWEEIILFALLLNCEILFRPDIFTKFKYIHLRRLSMVKTMELIRGIRREIDKEIEQSSLHEVLLKEKEFVKKYGKQLEEKQPEK